MSVTIADLLKLPSLRQAHVVAGKNGLGHIVTSISVLESIDPQKTGQNFPHRSHHYSHEIFITAFMDAKDNVDKQCWSIRRISEAGEVAVILFYVGAILKRIDNRVISLCDELKMPLIVMPENRVDLQYSDVIIEVAEAIIRDRREESSFTTTVMELLSDTPRPKRNINTVLQALRDQVQCSIFLVDETRQVLDSSEWPHGRTIPIDAIMNQLPEALPESVQSSIVFGDDTFYYSGEILRIGQSYLFVLIVREMASVPTEWARQISLVVRTYINLWAKDYGRIDSRRLISSIIYGEFTHARRAAAALRIHPETLRYTHLLFLDPSTRDYELLQQAAKALSEAFAGYRKDLILDVFDETIILLTADADIGDGLPSILAELADKGIPLRSVSQRNPEGAFDMNTLYQNCLHCRQVIPTVFPHRRSITSGEILFLLDALAKITDLSAVDAMTAPLLRPFSDSTLRAELVKTAQVYLLDAECSLTTTAEYMFLHLNTIKYRIRKIESCLGHRITRVPEVGSLYQAALLLRLKEGLV